MKAEIKIKAKFDRKKYLLSSLILIAGVAYCILGWLIDVPLGIKIIMSLTALVMVLFTVRTLADIIDTRIQLIIDERGLYWRRYKDEFIPWADVACITRYSLYQGRYFAVLLKSSPLFKPEDVRTEVQQVHLPLGLSLTLRNVNWFGVFDPAKVINDNKLTGEDIMIPDTLDCGFGRISIAIDYYLEQAAIDRRVFEEA